MVLLLSQLLQSPASLHSCPFLLWRLGLWHSQGLLDFSWEAIRHTLTGVWTCVCVCIRFSESLVHTDQVTRTIICMYIIPRIRCHHMQWCSGKYKGQSSQAAPHGQRAVLQKKSRGWICSEHSWGELTAGLGGDVGSARYSHSSLAGFHSGSHKPSLHLTASFLSLSKGGFSRWTWTSSALPSTAAMCMAWGCGGRCFLQGHFLPW